MSRLSKFAVFMLVLTVCSGCIRSSIGSISATHSRFSGYGDTYGSLLGGQQLDGTHGYIALQGGTGLDQEYTVTGLVSGTVGWYMTDTLSLSVSGDWYSNGDIFAIVSLDWSYEHDASD